MCNVGSHRANVQRGGALAIQHPMLALCLQSREKRQMPRPRKTNKSLKLHGTFRQDRHGADEPEPVGSLVMPAGLSGDAAWLWGQHVEQVQANGAGGGDIAVFVSACEWWGMYCDLKSAIASGDKDYRTFVKMSMAWKNFNTCASRLGLSPVERAKLRTQPTKKSKLSKFTG